MGRKDAFLWSILAAGVILLCLHATADVLAGNTLADRVWSPISLAVVLCLGGLLPREVRWVSAWAGFAAVASWFAFSYSWLNTDGALTPFFVVAAVLFLSVFFFRLSRLKAV